MNRRRPFDLRRPARRRWPPKWWAWPAIGGFLLFLVFLSRHNAQRSAPVIPQAFRDSIGTESLNVTDEMLNPLSITRQLVDQISLAKSLVIVSKENKNFHLAADLSTQIRRAQSLLSTSAVRDTPLTADEAEAVIREMAFLLFQAQQLHYDTATFIVKMKAEIDSLEESTKLLSEKSAKEGQITAEELPKGLYCLGVSLTKEWFTSPGLKRNLRERKRVSEKLKDNNLQHYCLFSDNILAASVVVNSTTMNSKHPDLVVFHLVTDEVNYVPMRAWFYIHGFRGATVDVQKVEDFTWLNASYVPVLKQLQDSSTQSFYFSGGGNDGTPIKFRNPKYLSMLNHLRFYIPEVYPSLHRVIFLDDDVIVQKDLSELFSINLNGNVMGAVDTCAEIFHRFHKYLNFSHPLIRAHIDPDACGWAFGMNVLDLREWRKRNVTGIYHYWQEKNMNHTLWRLGSLPPGLLAFYGFVEVLDGRWHVLGLGYTNVEESLIRDGAVLHYNGNRKPWLKIANEKYKGLWENYVDYSHPLLQRCLMH